MRRFLGKLRIVQGDRGAELLEFALLSVAFFLFVFGTMEFGRMIWQDNIVASAAKDGARWAAVRGASSGAPATANDVQTYVQSLTYGMTVTVTTTWNPADRRAGSVVQVVVQGSFTPIVSLLPQNTITLQSTAQMIVAR